MIPVGTSFLYLEPIYLQSTRSAFPQLDEGRRRVVDYRRLGRHAGQALRRVTSGAGPRGPARRPADGSAGGGPRSAADAGRTAANSPLPTDMPGLIQFANDALRGGEGRPGRGDFVTYGAEMQRLEAALQALDALRAGSVGSSPSPGQSTAPPATQAP